MTQAKKSSNFPNLNIELGEAPLKPFLNKEKLTEPNERVKNVKKKIYFRKKIHIYFFKCKIDVCCINCNFFLDCRDSSSSTRDWIWATAVKASLDGNFDSFTLKQKLRKNKLVTESPDQMVTPWTPTNKWKS